MNARLCPREAAVLSWNSCFVPVTVYYCIPGAFNKNTLILMRTRITAADYIQSVGTGSYPRSQHSEESLYLDGVFSWFEMSPVVRGGSNGGSAGKRKPTFWCEGCNKILYT